MRQHDPLHWQLTLVRERHDPETGEIKITRLKDTAANRNAGRFAKLPTPKDQKWTSRGAGVSHRQVRTPQAVIDARRVDGCARPVAAPEVFRLTGEGNTATIVAVDVSRLSKRMRKAMGV